jgi:hypothetical protein
MKFQKKQNLSFRIIKGQAFIVDAEKQTLHNLNETGTRIWQLLEKGKTFDEIAEILYNEFEVPKKQAEEDIKEFIDELERKKLIEKI